jgi:signal transduction histidine kinase
VGTGRDEAIEEATRETGSRRLDCRPIDLAPIVRSTAAAFGSLAVRKQIEVTCEVAERLPPVLGDPDRLTQVLHSLIGHAIEVTPQAGHIRVGVAQTRDELKVSVEDGGPAIPAAEQEMLFARFSHGERTDAEVTGLGLHTSRRIIEAHGGRIWVESAGGQGATLCFSLPLALT